MFENVDSFIKMGLFGQAADTLNNIIVKNLSNEEKNTYAIYQGMVLYEQGHYQKSMEWLNYNFDQSFIESNKIFFFTGLVFKAMIMIRTSQLSEGIAYLKNLLPEIINIKDNSLESLIYNWFGNTYWLQGNLKESLGYHELALSLRRNLGNDTTLATTLNNIGLIYRVQGKLKKSIEIYNELVSFNLPSVKGKSSVLVNRGLSYFELGDLHNALNDQIKGYDLRIASGSPYLISDSIFNIIRIAYSLKNLTLLEDYIKKFDSMVEIPSVNTLRLMSNAYIKMLTDPKSSLDDWNEALQNKSLEFGYKLLCYEELLSIYSTQSSFKHENILALLDNFEIMSKDNNLFASLAKIYFVRALIYKNFFEIQKAEKYLNDVISISLVHGLPFHENLARIELKNLKEHMNKFNLIYQHQPADEVELDYKNIISYIKNFKSILSEKFET